MAKIDELKKVYDELLVIFEDVRTLLYDIGRYNPGIEAEGLQPLSTLAHTMGTIVTQLNSLRVDTLKIHERRFNEPKK